MMWRMSLANSSGTPYPTVSGMFSVVAPLSTASWQTSTTKSISERLPSSGENSTSSQ